MAPVVINREALVPKTKSLPFPHWAVGGGERYHLLEDFCSQRGRKTGKKAERQTGRQASRHGQRHAEAERKTGRKKERLTFHKDESTCAGDRFFSLAMLRTTGSSRRTGSPFSALGRSGLPRGL